MSYAIFDTHNGDSEWNHRSGQRAEILRELTEEEADICDVGRMFRIRFEDGTETDAFEDELTIEEAAAEPGMRHGPYTKVLDFFRDSQAAERFIRYDGPHYTVLLSAFPTWNKLDIRKRDDAPRFRPNIYIREDSNYSPVSLDIQTTSYGALTMDEMKGLHKELGIAIEAAGIIQREFIDPIRAGTFVFGECLPRPEKQEGGQ